MFGNKLIIPIISRYYNYYGNDNMIFFNSLYYFDLLTEIYYCLFFFLKYKKILYCIMHSIELLDLYHCFNMLILILLQLILNKSHHFHMIQDYLLNFAFQDQ